MSVAEVLQWAQLLNVLLVPILVYLVKMEHRLTIVEQYERRLVLLETKVFYDRRLGGAINGGLLP